MRIADPLWLLALVVVPVFALRAFPNRRVLDAIRGLRVPGWARRGIDFLVLAPSEARVLHSDVSRIPRVAALRARLARALPVLPLLALVFGIVALARPQAGLSGEEISSSGVDIMLALDISGSMRAEDFAPHRLGALKRVVKDFIKGRSRDRIGLVIFAGEAVTQCPLTVDYGVLLDLLDHLSFDSVGADGTAIGVGIATAANRLREGKAKSKVLILLTDGNNNAGDIDPLSAAKACDAYDIKLYTIGMGGDEPAPVRDPESGAIAGYVEPLNAEPLAETAAAAGGRFFRATSSGALSEIYKRIDKMEKSDYKVKEFTRYKELYESLAAMALICLGAYFGLRHTWLRRLP